MRSKSDRISASDAAPILRGVLRLGRRLRAERTETGISLAGIGLLASLERNGPLPAARLADSEGLQAQSVTRLLAALDAAGCIARHRGETDRRETIVSLTEQGRALLQAEMHARRSWLAQAMTACLSEEECAALRAAAPVMLKLADAGGRA